MQLFTSHILIFTQISIACLFFSISGFLLKYLIFKKKDTTQFTENGLFVLNQNFFSELLEI